VGRKRDIASHEYRSGTPGNIIRSARHQLIFFLHLPSSTAKRYSSNAKQAILRDATASILPFAPRTILLISRHQASLLTAHGPQSSSISPGYRLPPTFFTCPPPTAHNPHLPTANSPQSSPAYRQRPTAHNPHRLPAPDTPFKRRNKASDNRYNPQGPGYRRYPYPEY